MIPPSQRTSSSALVPGAHDTDTASIRPRNRRLVSNGGNAAGSSSSAFSTPGQSPSRSVTPIPTARIGAVTGRNNEFVSSSSSASRARSPAGGGGGLFGGSSWVPSWSAVHELASSLLAGGGDSTHDSFDGTGSRSRDTSRTRKPRGSRQAGRTTDTWGPEPPGGSSSSKSRPRLEDVAAGSLAKREARLKTMRTASVLESHEGVNGGLDVAGNFKKRNSDEDLRGSSSRGEEQGEHLVYIHHVKPSDTYAGIILKYRCREDAFRKANGLWSRDNIQVRKWLALPVDACEVKGRTCDGPPPPLQSVKAAPPVDLLAPTPPTDDPFRHDDDFFSNGHSLEPSSHTEEEKPWTHVRWVAVDSFPEPVEIARVARKALGYFPPRRKKSIRSASTLSTPRQSVDVPSFSLTSDPPALDSPGSTSSRRHSLLSGPRPSLAHRPSTSSVSGRSRVGSVGDDLRPAWMRRPGGVGSLGRHVRAPGPDKDYFNSWTNKHLPGLNIDSLPSMSVMGSEMARFGMFDINPEEPPLIVENPSSGEGGGVLSTLSSSARNQGSGLDKAAAAIETWLRGAFANSRRPSTSTPLMGPSSSRFGGRPLQLPEEGVTDLIELADTNSDDGRSGGGGGGVGWGEGSGCGGDMGLLSSTTTGTTTTRSSSSTGVRGRSGAGAVNKNRKAD
ncbi:hypothetical protein QBC46DRAFT_253189 [Diplogelasinospora grovesii]|uniref:LysM domain-containing protein n=1 Tax=Diplogelasinospora grovesii TaxID=303347 RepID=A0AAN6NHP4_9PEZI|nr:hypothetical protein QBC46DRAFT_253189 [Diplogelasinospora grovesii]